MNIPSNSDGKKATARDVAREAGVSVATVSYIMNNRSDQKISPETRKKVLQIANLLNYVPSHAAQSLATGRNNAIGVSYLLNGSPSHNADILFFVNRLIERLNRLKYDVTFIPARNAGEGLPINRGIDAIIAIDLSQSDFRSLADNYLVPVICVDMLVNDTLFYQIYEDIPFLVEKALLTLGNPSKCYFLYDSYGNSSYDDFVIGLPENIFAIKSRDITPSLLEQIKDTPLIINGGYLALSLLNSLPTDKICILSGEEIQPLLPQNVKVLFTNDDKKANLTMSILMNALKRNFEVTHDHRVR